MLAVLLGTSVRAFLVAMETLYAGRGFRDVRFVDTISYGRKTDRPTVYDHVRGRLVLAHISVDTMPYPPRTRLEIRNAGSRILKHSFSDVQPS